jgi:protein TonB
MLSVAVHAAMLLLVLSRSESPALEEGNGRNDLRVVVSVNIETGDLSGLDTKNQQAANAAPRVMQQPEPVQEDSKNVESPKAEPPPVPKPQTEMEKPQPEFLEAKPMEEKRSPSRELPVAPPATHEPQQSPASPTDAQEEQQQASRPSEGSRIQLFSLYKGKVLRVVTRRSLNPRSSRAGRVVVLVTISPSGELISRTIAESSGSDILDNAALATVDRSAPFPAMPRELGPDPLELRIPFEFSVRQNRG